jgi:hypothetical protein
MTGQNQAGWYPDPENTSQTRYWDGTLWTVHVRSAAVDEPTAPLPAPPAPTSRAATEHRQQWMSATAPGGTAMPARRPWPSGPGRYHRVHHITFQETC